MGIGNPNIKNYGFGSRPKEVDDEYRSRIAGVPRERIWTKEKCCRELEDCLEILKKILKEDEKIEAGGKKLKQETVRDMNTMMNRILEFVRYLYPPVVTNVNVNMEIGFDAIVDRVRKYEKEMVVDIVEEKKEEIKDETQKE